MKVSKLQAKRYNTNKITKITDVMFSSVSQKGFGRQMDPSWRFSHFAFELMQKYQN